MSNLKPYPKYKPSEVEWLGNVPEHWDSKRLRFLASYQNSNVDKKTYEGQKTVRLCNYTDVYYNEKITSDLDFMVATASDSEIESMSLRIGDVIITKDSEDPTDIGVPAIVAEEFNDIVCGYHLTVIRSGNLATSRLLHRAIQSAPSMAQFYIESPGVTRFGLNQGTIGSLWIATPPEDEREHIAAFLNRETAHIDSLVEEKTRFIELLKEKRQALITQAVTKGLNPNVKMKDSGVEWIGKVPEHWDVKQYRYSTQLFRGKFGHRPRNDPRFYGGKYPFIQTGDIARAEKFIISYKQTLNEKGRGVSQKFPTGTLVMAIAANIGNTAILNFEAYCPDSVVGFKPHNSVSLDYLRFSFIASLQALEQTSTQSTQANLNLDRIGSVCAAFPPKKEQLEIIKELEHHEERDMNLKHEVQKSIELLKERRTALITAAVTGKIDVRNH